MNSITLTGILNKDFEIVVDTNAAFGFHVRYEGKLYEPSLGLKEVSVDEYGYVESVSSTELTLREPYRVPFPNIQGHVISDNEIFYE